MRGVDTNVLVRFLVADDRRQATKVRTLFERAEETRDPLFVSVPVILETLWVLASVYDIPGSAVLESLQQLLDLACLRFEAEARIRTLIAAARDTNIDLADLLIGLTAQDNNCLVTVTLDRKAARDKRFELL